MEQKNSGGEYAALRARHDTELKEMLQAAVDECGSITSASRKLVVNVGTMWRMCERLGVRVSND
jgi:molybdenum-dependent DNA-binding transcriptional regulator ModE